MAGNVPQPRETNPVRLAQACRDLFEGRSNAVGTVTLTLNSATTVVSFENVGLESRVFLMPTTAAAAAEFGNGTIYVSAVDRRQFTITHANSGTTGRTFFFVALG